MKDKLKSFFQMTKFEAIRITRNKFVIFMLLFFALFFIVILSSINTEPVINFAILTKESTSNTDSDTLFMFDKYYDEENVKQVVSKEEGLKLLKNGKVAIFLEIDETTTPQNVVVHYDSSSFAGNFIKNEIANKKDTLSFDLVTKYLEDFGVKINKDYFNFVSFSALNGEELSSSLRSFPLELGIGISVILMLGLAYSVAKDNETNIAKNITYLPIGINKYLFSKLLPYILLGIIETLLLLLFGQLCFHIKPATNLLLIVLLTIPFIMSTSILGLLFSNFKNQVSTFFCDLFVLLVPVLVSSITYLNGMPLIIKIFLYMTPMTPFVQLLNGMIFNGSILWLHIIILITQTIIFYVINYFIVKKRTQS